MPGPISTLLSQMTSRPNCVYMCTCITKIELTTAATMFTGSALCNHGGDERNTFRVIWLISYDMWSNRNCFVRWVCLYYESNITEDVDQNKNIKQRQKHTIKSTLDRAKFNWTNGIFPFGSIPLCLYAQWLVSNEKFVFFIAFVLFVRHSH